MKIVGLTGSIGMGKSALARDMRRAHIPVHEADRVVHQLLSPRGKAREAVAAAFPQAVDAQGHIDRVALGRAVFADKCARARLEGILYPLIKADRARFIKQARAQRRKAVILDIPLLFETQNPAFFDDIWVVTAPYFVQSRRVLSRPAMTPEKLRAILKLQMPDARKRVRADCIINTARGRRYALQKARAALKAQG